MRIGFPKKILAGAAAWAGLAALPSAAANTASISPTWVESRHPFTLALVGEGPMCAPIFSHQSSLLRGKNLVLSVLEQDDPRADCNTKPAPWPYRAEFDVPALDSGEYTVQVRWAQACEFDPTPCPVAYQPQDVGNLRVTDSAGLGYSFAPRTARGGQAFQIRLRSDGFNCGDVVKSATVTVARPILNLDFIIEPHPEVVCIAPFPGIDFAVPALDAGGWQVYAARAPYCPAGTVCPLALLAPQLAGALEVSPGVEAVVPLRPRSPAGPARMGPAVFRWNGSPYDAMGKSRK